MSDLKPVDWTFSFNPDVLMEDHWLQIYAVLRRQIMNGDESRQDVLKACERIIADFEDKP